MTLSERHLALLDRAYRRDNFIALRVFAAGMVLAALTGSLALVVLATGLAVAGMDRWFHNAAIGVWVSLGISVACITFIGLTAPRLPRHEMAQRTFMRRRGGRG